VAANSKNFVILVCTVLIQYNNVTGGQADRQTPRRWIRREKHYMLSRVIKIKTLCLIACDSFVRV